MPALPKRHRRERAKARPGPGRCAHHALKPSRTTPGRSRSLRRSSGDVWCVGPTSRTIHLIVDNYSTHKHRHVKSWFERHARFHAHFIPTSSSWLNLVERFFREITDRRIRRGIFRSVQELHPSHLRLSQISQREPETLRMDKNRRPNPQQTRPPLRQSGIIGLNCDPLH